MAALASPTAVARPPQRPDEDEEDPLLGNLLEIAWLRKWTILACLVVGLVAGLVHLSRATPVFRSTVTIFMDQSLPPVIGGAGGAVPQQSMNAQTQVLTSSAILGRAVELPAMKQAASLWQQANPVGYLRSALSVSAQDGGDLINLSLASPHSQDNAIILNTVVQAFAEYHTERRSSTAAEVLKILQREKDELNREVKETTGFMLAFQREHGAAALRAGDGSSVFGSRVARLANTLTEAELRTLETKLAYETAVDAGDDLGALRLIAATDPTFEGFDLATTQEVGAGAPPEAAVIASLRQDRKLLVEAAGLLPSHRSVVRIDTAIEGLEAQIRQRGALVPEQGATAGSGSSPAEIASFYRDLLRQRWQSAAEAEREYRAIFEAQQTEAVGLNSQYAEYALLESSLARADRQLELIDTRIRELNLTDDYDVIDVTVLEPAEAAALPFKPRRAQVMGMALVLALMAGGGLAFLQEMMDDRLRNGEEIQSLLGQAILGSIPALQEKDPGLCARAMDVEPQSLVAEAFRTVRTAIQFSPAGSNAQVIMVTSPSPGDGKSTVAANLAIAIAQAGNRTLLIDADCRKPRQHRHFDVESERGLAVLLSEKRSADEFLASPILSTSVRGLHLLPCGPTPENPAELLNHARFARLIGQLRGHYDRILIDTPPTVPVSDSRIIAAVTDGYVLVLRAGKSGRRMARHAADLLRGVGAVPLGMVINGVTSSWGGYAYYNRYGYYQQAYGDYRDDAGTRGKVASEGSPPRKKLPSAASRERGEA